MRSLILRCTQALLLLTLFASFAPCSVSARRLEWRPVPAIVKRRRILSDAESEPMQTLKEVMEDSLRNPVTPPETEAERMDASAAQSDNRSSLRDTPTVDESRNVAPPPSGEDKSSGITAKAAPVVPSSAATLASRDQENSKKPQEKAQGEEEEEKAVEQTQAASNTMVKADINTKADEDIKPQTESASAKVSDSAVSQIQEQQDQETPVSAGIQESRVEEAKQSGVAESQVSEAASARSSVVTRGTESVSQAAADADSRVEPEPSTRTESRSVVAQEDVPKVEVPKIAGTEEKATEPVVESKAAAQTETETKTESETKPATVPESEAESKPQEVEEKSEPEPTQAADPVEAEEENKESTNTTKEKEEEAEQEVKKEAVGEVDDNDDGRSAIERREDELEASQKTEADMSSGMEAVARDKDPEQEEGADVGSSPSRDWSTSFEVTTDLLDRRVQHWVAFTPVVGVDCYDVELRVKARGASWSQSVACEALPSTRLSIFPNTDYEISLSLFTDNDDEDVPVKTFQVRGNDEETMPIASYGLTITVPQIVWEQLVGASKKPQSVTKELESRVLALGRLRKRGANVIVTKRKPSVEVKIMVAATRNGDARSTLEKIRSMVGEQDLLGKLVYNGQVAAFAYQPGSGPEAKVGDASEEEGDVSESGGGISFLGLFTMFLILAGLALFAAYRLGYDVRGWIEGLATGRTSYARLERQRQHDTFERIAEERFDAQARQGNAVALLRSVLRALNVPDFAHAGYEKKLSDAYITTVAQLKQLNDDDWRRLDFPTLVESRMRREVERIEPRGNDDNGQEPLRMPVGKAKRVTIDIERNVDHSEPDFSDF